MKNLPHVWHVKFSNSAVGAPSDTTVLMSKNLRGDTGFLEVFVTEVCH